MTQSRHGVLLVFVPLASFACWWGQEHGQTIPLADIAPLSSALERRCRSNESRDGALELFALPIGNPSSAFLDTVAEPKTSSRFVLCVRAVNQERFNVHKISRRSAIRLCSD
jgi:hypothetical protein